MAMTIEELEKECEGKTEDEWYLEMQARLGTKEDAESAYDEDGNFHCIEWFDCNFCPAFNPQHCI